MRQLLYSARAVAGLTVERIDEDTRLFELAGGDLHLRLVEPGFNARGSAQEFISQAYRRAFGSELCEFYPSLIALRGRDQALRGAAGARYAQGQSLFLEQYLDRPVESLIQAASGEPVARSQVVEVGNLSVDRPALTYPYIGMLGAWLRTYQVDWIVFALTSSLRRLFQRADVDLLDLGPAESARLAPSRNAWGAYYTHDPRVMAARLGSGLDRFLAHHPGVTTRRNGRAPEGRVACQR